MEELKIYHQIWLLILNEFERINKVLFPLKASENLWSLDDFRGSIS